MEAGQELDKIIAANVMGISQLQVAEYENRLTGEHRSVFTDLKHYSTDLSDAWDVAEILREKYGYDYTLFQHPSGDWIVTMEMYQLNSENLWVPTSIRATRSKTAPHAICLAALRALGFSRG